MSQLLEDLDFIVEAEPGVDVRALYDRAADRYDHFRDLWLRLAGAGAERAMLDDVAESVRAGAAVLDAGCGTGALARRIRDVEPGVELTLLDLSPGMLARATDVPGRRMVGSVLGLPFAAESFDVVVSAWVIETVDDPGRAVREFLRVLRPGGRVLYTFCSLPDGWLSRAGSAWLRGAVRRGFAGDFLPVERAPWHDCGSSHRVRFRGGLTTEVSLGSCCHVDAPVLPPRRP
jgi:ubiquinone/menaquinone biosynthesis C-methylase UbiE